MIGSSKRATLPRMADEMDAFNPPSSAPRIPQSIIRPRAESFRNPLHSTIHATPTRRSSSVAERSNDMLGIPIQEYGDSIQATPSRKTIVTEHPHSLLAVPTADYSTFLPSSPLQQRHSASTEKYGTVPDSVTRHTSNSLVDQEIQETPIKKRTETIVHSHPASFASNNKENTKSKAESAHRQRAADTKDDIYKALGWDEDDDDELA